MNIPIYFQCSKNGGILRFQRSSEAITVDEIKNDQTANYEPFKFGQIRTFRFLVILTVISL